MKVNGKHYKTVWMKGNFVYLIEQNLLPFQFKVFKSKTYKETCHAIKTMIVRGAGAIGATAGFAMAQGLLEAPKKGFWRYAQKAKIEIEATRPTAQNLFFAVNRVFNSAKSSKDPVKAGIDEAQRIAKEDEESCKTIGKLGNELIKDGFSIETHCNAGWLAFVDYGTALSPIYAAKRAGKKVFVYVDETRPRGQGARLTAWELQNENIPHAILPDNAGAHIMSLGKVDLIIVGADRIAANGDTANKIGTLEKAICAKEYGIPFYVTAPTSTFDLNCTKGEDIIIEERSEEEVLYQTGLLPNKKRERILVCSPYSHAINPAFDVTPAKYITGIITEKGIVKPMKEAIKKLFSK
ncbi:S-methyl-5-thioribose-1-phosphate isomerase [candidate division WOR-1 bacterium RIFOXYA2_FULL_37_7]|uniref:Methylthioribose-1-phosphate isomerase n=1 Tax=candidate division WOR-1 bacterium RIFOXYB2_FULL_37_13 TaxID=1802579 RepID=A0A1F4SJT6_UNCSA|nr:MAG: S-methyl-5-thioribose-1-phosphate isomerase [candidate division WOR-1 bacterium RIFOXYA2_FULL_37_7]OGC19943.1 MAG: S-methyl-5-thioribose-1-phosphate isomerase [candidate division WOR-1 bacterium RIFOXYB2_FULL_37_13]